jgi:hypothetical protein
MDLSNLVQAYYNSMTSFDKCCHILEEPFQDYLRVAVDTVCAGPKNTISRVAAKNLCMLRIQTTEIIKIVKPQWEQANRFGGYGDDGEQAKKYKRDHLNVKHKLAVDVLKKKPTLLGDDVPHGLSPPQQERFNLYMFFLTKAYIDPRDRVRCLWFKTCAQHHWAVCAQMIVCSSAGAPAITENFVLGAYRANAQDAANGINKNYFRGLSMNLPEYEGYDERTAKKFWMDYVVDGTGFPGSSDLEEIQGEKKAAAHERTEVLLLSSDSIHHTHIHCPRR